jgi:HEPN domain-containing protein
MGMLRADSNAAEEAARWLAWADKDYISARVLLLRDLLVQGTTLSNTAVEKYFKTVCLLANAVFPRVHEVSKLAGIVRSAGVNLNLNQGYLSLLSKAYKLRYPDDLKPGYNIVLSQPKLLTELDFTAFEIRKGFGFQRSSGKQVQTYFDNLIARQDSALLDLNIAFSQARRDEVFGEKNKCYELRILPNGTCMEAEYATTGIVDDRKFDEVGLKPSP